MMYSCDKFAEDIVSYFEKELSKENTVDFDNHKADCANCGKSFADMEKLSKKFETDEFGVPPHLLEQIITQITKTQK